MRVRTVTALVAALLTMTGALAAVSSAAGSVQSVDSSVVRDDGGRHLKIGGLLSCTQREAYRLRVTVTQRGTAAVATGGESGDCATTVTVWSLKASRHGRAAFVNGPARVCAVMVTKAGDRLTDANQWCQDVTVRTA